MAHLLIKMTCVSSNIFEKVWACSAWCSMAECYINIITSVGEFYVKVTLQKPCTPHLVIDPQSLKMCGWNWLFSNWGTSSQQAPCLVNIPYQPVLPLVIEILFWNFVRRLAIRGTKNFTLAITILKWNEVCKHCSVNYSFNFFAIFTHDCLNARPLTKIK